MNREKVFVCHPRFRFCTPVSEAYEAVMRGVETGASLILDQSSDTAVKLSHEAHQWLYCQSSGSSGAPKTVRRTPTSWRSSFDVSAQLFSIGPSDVYATLGAMGHSLTLYATLEAVELGAGLCPLGGSGPRVQVQGLRRFGVTVLYATPSQLRLLLRGALAERIEKLSLRLVLVGGGKLDMDLRRGLQTLCPDAEIREFFGASETSFITLSDEATPPGSVGRGYPGVEVLVEAEPGRKGEIWVRSPYLFDGYANGESADTHWRDGFLSIGEIGHLDAQGYLYLHGRKSRMVTVADQNVFPEKIEAIVSSLSDGNACAVVAMPEPLRGNSLACVVESESAPEPILRQQIRNTLGPAAVPRTFHVVSHLPLLPAGKPDLKAITDMLADLK
ncbi:AMP-binding protein [Lutimaribacter marinistellae]|uniref:AMP-binding protein n=1 Tax=Lutimaribacter marinistellae TaxID=1820329 RepID=A0ABV7TCR4_9RHOB